MARTGYVALLGLLFLGFSAAAHASQYAVLANGNRVRIERHQADGQKLFLHLEGGGVVEVSAADVVRFEADEYTPPPPPPPAETPAPQQPAVPAEIQQIVQSSAERHGIDPDLVHSVIRAESGGRTNAVSPKGAGGLMQLMPATARDLNVANVFDPAQNVEGGTRYLRQLLSQYNNDMTLALAAYNAGPQKVNAYGGIPPYRETNEYVRRVISSFNAKKLAVQNQ